MSGFLFAIIVIKFYYISKLISPGVGVFFDEAHYRKRVLLICFINVTQLQ